MPTGCENYMFQCTRAIPSRMNTEPAQPDDFASLYRRAFAAYSIRALWNKRELDVPTREDALVIARALRVEGNREARQLAERIERACRADKARCFLKAELERAGVV